MSYNSSTQSVVSSHPAASEQAANPKQRKQRSPITHSRIKQSRISHQPVHNRIMAALSHCPRYAFKGGKRLAQDCGASSATISRIVTGQSSPSYTLVVAITKALEKHLGRSIDPREIISPDGTYPTPSICSLMGCKGCLPQEAFGEDATLTDSYQHVAPGTWDGSVQPQSRKELR